MTVLILALLTTNIVCLLLFILLIVNYKHLDNQLKEKKTDLEKLNNIREKHLIQLSHDLRTPLNVIMGYTSLLINKVHGEINPKQHEDIMRVKENSNKILKILEEFFRQNY